MPSSRTRVRVPTRSTSNSTLLTTVRFRELARIEVDGVPSGLVCSENYELAATQKFALAVQLPGTGETYLYCMQSPSGALLSPEVLPSTDRSLQASYSDVAAIWDLNGDQRDEIVLVESHDPLWDDVTLPIRFFDFAACRELRLTGSALLEQLEPTVAGLLDEAGQTVGIVVAKMRPSGTVFGLMAPSLAAPAWVLTLPTMSPIEAIGIEDVDQDGITDVALLDRFTGYCVSGANGAVIFNLPVEAAAVGRPYRVVGMNGPAVNDSRGLVCWYVSGGKKESLVRIDSGGRFINSITVSGVDQVILLCVLADRQGARYPCVIGRLGTQLLALVYDDELGDALLVCDLGSYPLINTTNVVSRPFESEKRRACAVAIADATHVRLFELALE